ncbi:aminotransferase class III-fold pyridoxal phosphate-dependent enzyme [Bacillus toyonensis]|uniref:aminotransferase class III-fold pyridoxal phosphate-dependent enzyme n=1 Tax=Bacillus toyonensis TaxID=155322 RepID=UPI0021CDEEED|nr:aminotransferase class III-fold pyridoxal phosphate-dependent enzyme [Bacillus toyonensis]MCU5583187.1 aminotransferase class III-fold pyridoxal phosphate-dependent enzyme [Bacillus toyonensis]
MHSYIVPMGPIHQSTLYDIEVGRAEDSYIFGVNGKRYLDLRSGLWNVSLGYKKELYENICTSFSEILKDGIPFIDIHSYRHKSYDDFSKMLLDFINHKNSNFKRVFYTNSGSEGTELAIKISRQISKEKKTIISFKDGYHGTFFGGMAVSGIDEHITDVYAPKPLDFKFLKTPTNIDSLNLIVDFLENNSEKIAAFFIEPIVGSGGTLIIKNDYLDTIIRTCREKDILVVFDEVATGFYRTGTKFKFHALRYAPDMIILSKSINNGILPFGTVIVNEKIENMLGFSHIEHFSTQNGNVLGVISAYKTLEYYKKHNDCILSSVKEIETIYQNALNLENIFFRGQGGMLSIPITNKSTMFSLINRLKNFGILTYYYISPDGECGLTIFPSLLIEKTKFQKAMKVVIKMIKETYS